MHWDIKPENILINSDFTIKIADFGFIKNCNENSILTDYISTRWYRAPEILVGRKYDQKVDIFAFGCLMAELWLLQPLFPGWNELE